MLRILPCLTTCAAATLVQAIFIFSQCYYNSLLTDYPLSLTFIFQLQCNSHIIQFILLNVQFSGFEHILKVLQAQPLSNFRTFSSLQKETSYLSLPIHYLPTISSHQPVICFLFLWVCLLYSFHVNGFIPYVLCISDFFHLPKVFSIHPVCSRNQPFMINVWIYHILFTHSSVDEHLAISTFWLLWTVLPGTFTYQFLHGNMFSILLGII